MWGRNDLPYIHSQSRTEQLERPFLVLCTTFPTLTHEEYNMLDIINITVHFVSHVLGDLIGTIAGSLTGFHF